MKGVLERSDEKEGRTPWNLLEDYTTKGDAQAGLLWKEYAKAISGKQRLSWSREVRALGLTDEYEPEGDQLVRKVPADEWAEAARPEADSRAAVLVRTRKRRKGRREAGRARSARKEPRGRRRLGPGAGAAFGD